MLNRYGLVTSVLLCAAAFVACGGGGGGGSVAPSGPSVTPTTPPGSGASATPTMPGASATPTMPGASATPTVKPTATGAAYTLPSSNPASPSQFSVNSNPTGLSVTVDGMAYTTPIAPAIGYGAHAIVFTPKNGAPPYAVNVSNTGNGPITAFYNQSSDSSGKIGGGIATSGVRRAASLDASILRRSASSAGNRPAFADGVIEVQYDLARIGVRTFAAIESMHGVARARTLTQTATQVVRVLDVPAAANADALVTSMRSEAGVASASRVGLRYPAAMSNGTFYPSDTYFKATNNGANADQWYLYAIDMPDAWGYGSGKAPIAVVDTGYDPNQTEIAPLVTTAETILNLTLYTGTATDTDGHGTFLSGVADAVTNNAAGFAGAAYNAPLQEYKIFATGAASAQTTDEAAAIREAVKNGAKVILLALQSAPGNGPDPAERDAVAYAIANGVTVVASSGDDNGSALDYPAAYPGVISVGASIANDAGTPGTVVGQGNSEAVAAYSNAGPGLTLVAPGGQGTGSDPDILHWIENAYTTQPSAGLPACAAGTAPADCKILFTGTSPAAALVAGTASLMLTVNGGLAPAQVAQLLTATTDDIRDPKQGAGRLNAQRAVALAAGDTAAQPAFPLPRAVQFVAFGYVNSGAALPAAPTIVDAIFKTGVSVNQDGTFRIADINPTSLPNGATTYKIGVWLSLAGDGKVHAGDYFASATCSINASCSAAIANVTVAKLGGATLP